MDQFSEMLLDIKKEFEIQLKNIGYEQGSIGFDDAELAFDTAVEKYINAKLDELGGE